MPERDAAPSTSTGPNPGGAAGPDSPMPGGAVTGQAGIGDAVTPGHDDLGGESDMGTDRDEDAREQVAQAEDAAMGSPEEEARRGRPSVAPGGGRPTGPPRRSEPEDAG